MVVLKLEVGTTVHQLLQVMVVVVVPVDLSLTVQLVVKV